MSNLPPQRVLGPHDVFDPLHFLLVAPSVFHGALLGLLQCTLQASRSSPPAASSSARRHACTRLGHTTSPLRQRFSSISSFWRASLRVLFFSFSFSNFFFHCSAVSSKLTEACHLTLASGPDLCPNISVDLVSASL
uniref:Transmembrane protein n=1 Tax=Erpetoichthys calabaricus TaxID=27687 RepID=A0A8C4SY82_ERPCA